MGTKVAACGQAKTARVSYTMIFVAQIKKSHNRDNDNSNFIRECV